MDTVHFRTREKWRSWLQKNRDKYAEIWLLFYKKFTGIRSISYDDAVEEALCFGWIDSTIRKIDNERYARKFTKRIKNSRWSELNIRRAEKMISEGLMKDSGKDAYVKRKSYDKTDDERRTKRTVRPPAFLIIALKNNPSALKNFNNLAKGYKKQMILWLLDAKKQETRERRVKEVLKVLSKNEKLGMK